MIKYISTFISENGIEVVLKLRKYKKSYYEVEFVCDCDLSYFGSIMKNGSKWEIFTNQDNYWDYYCSVAFKTLKDAIEYIGITDIENKQY